ncbi:tetratricopeptide repeat protein [Streptomyces sp. NPDC088789]|uniref:tetratricopeptide repeat protein n=1 Tax=Streptomyces sp. NPDC088789 TaxID=3365899 RepID=UPI0037FBFF9A
MRAREGFRWSSSRAWWPGTGIRTRRSLGCAPESRTRFSPPLWSTSPKEQTELLAGAGRIEEAVAVLEQHAAPANTNDLAGYLIELGRVNDAVVLLQQRDSEPVSPVWTGLPFNEPPF